MVGVRVPGVRMPGVRVPLFLATGLGLLAVLADLGSCGVDDRDARLLGRLVLAFDGTPNESRLMPPLAISWTEDAEVEACDARFLTATELGRYWPAALGTRGLARGGVDVGAGSLERAECTRSSSFCILPISPRIWYRDPDLGRPAADALFPMLGRVCLCPGAALGGRIIEGVRRPPAFPPWAGIPETLGRRVCRGRAKTPALGVAAGSCDTIDAFLVSPGALNGIGRIARGASDRGGEGGVESGRMAPV